MHIYTAYNGPMPTTAAQASVSTGTTAKTMLQISPPSTRQIQLLEWGWSIDDPPGADGVVELLQTDVAATVTAHVAAGVQPMTPGIPASLVTLGTANTGYSASSEGTTTASRVFDVMSISSTTSESGLSGGKIWLPGRGPIVSASTFLRVRMTTPTTAVDARCWVRWDE